MNATINGIDYTDAKEAKNAIRRATAQARKEAKDHNRRHDGARKVSHAAFTCVAHFIQRRMDGLRITWNITKPRLTWDAATNVATAEYNVSNQWGRFEHWQTQPDAVLLGGAGDIAVRIGAFWYAIGLYESTVNLHEIPAFMAAHLDAFAAEKAGN